MMMKLKLNDARFSALILMGMITSNASAQGGDPIAPFRECGAIAGPEERLACFDNALQRSHAVAAQRQADQNRRRIEDFGLSEVQVIERDRTANPSARSSQSTTNVEPTSVQSTLVEVFTDGARKRVFLLENGQVWREVSGSNYDGILRSGWATEIKKGRLGGYRLSFEGRVGFFSVQRVR